MKEKSMEDPDNLLVKDILAGDKRSLYLFYKRYKEKLHAFIRSKVDKEQDQEEILQDTFFGFLEALRDYHGQSSIKTFLYAICHHKVIDFYRRKKFRHLVFSQMPQLEGLISTLMEPEEEFNQSELQQRIKDSFSAIAPLYQKILQYKYIEGRSVEEIASILAISFKSAESKLFRARKAFVAAYLSSEY